MAIHSEILEFFESRNYPERDQNVLLEIQNWMSNNNDAMIDGIIDSKIIFGQTVQTKFENLYNITDKEWKEFKRKNAMLRNNFEVTKHLIRHALLISYHTTKNKIFLDFLGIILWGALWGGKYFKRGTDANVMKYVIENVLTQSSYIKKNGSAYLTIQDITAGLLKDNGGKINKQLARLNDKDIVDVINSIYTRINSTIKILNNHYYHIKGTKDAQYILSVNDQADEGRLSLTNNSVKAQNLKQAIEAYDTKVLDEGILKTLRVESPLKVGCITSLITDKEKQYFKKYGNLYLDYYLTNNPSDWNRMKQDFIKKSNTARTNSQEMKTLDKSMYKDIQVYVRNYVKLSKGTAEDLNRNLGLLKFVRIVKDYIILKIRQMMNDL